MPQQQNQSVAALLTILQDGHGPCLCDAARDLAKRGFGNEAVRLLVTIFHDPMRRSDTTWSVSALALIGITALPTLLKELEDPKSDVRTNAVLAICRMTAPPKKALEALIKTLWL